MKNILSKRLIKIKPSLTVSINIKANALREEGRDVLVLAPVLIIKFTVLRTIITIIRYAFIL